MKRFLTLAVALLATTLSGCKISEYDDKGYSLVYPGIYMWGQARSTNKFALDAVSMGFRLGVLLDEMDEAGLVFDPVTGAEPDWSELSDLNDLASNYTSNFNIREYLFGTESKCEIAQVIGEANPTYTITFEDYASTPYDNYAYSRKGCYRVVVTRGTRLSGYSSSFEILGEDVYFGWTSDYTNIEMQCTDVYATIGCSQPSGDSTHQFGFTGSLTYLDGDEDSQSWVSDGVLEIEDFNNSLLIADTYEKNFKYGGTEYDYAFGTTIAGYLMTYDIIEPLVYNLSVTPFYEIGGYEEATITGYIDESIFPVDYVEVETLSNASKIVYYNGTTYQ